MPSPSRRDVLAAGGVLAGLGAGYYVGVARDSTADRTAVAGDPAPLSWTPTDWPHPDYDAANTRHPPAASEPAADLTVAWRRALGDVYERARPVVANGDVYTASADGQADRLRAFSTTDGGESWQREYVGEASSTDPRVRAPGSDVYYRFAAFEGGPLGAVAGSTGDHVWGVADPPGGGWTVGGGRLYYGDANTGDLRAYDARTGDDLWTTSVDDDRLVVEAYHPEYGVFGTSFGTLRALDPADGSEQWSAPVPEHTRSGPIVAGGLAVVSKWLDGGEVVAFDAGDGTESWRYELPESGDSEARAWFDVDAATGERVLARDARGDDSPDGLNAVDAATGERRWRVTPPEDLSSFTRPTVVGDSVYVCAFGDDRSVLLRLSLADGTQTGSWPLPGVTRGVVVADEQVLVQTATELVAYE